MRNIEYLEHIIMITQLGDDWIANVFSANVTKTKSLKLIIGFGEHAVESEARHFIEGLAEAAKKSPHH
jgi:hypothetical protein